MELLCDPMVGEGNQALLPLAILAHEGQLLNFQEFCEPVVKNSLKIKSYKLTIK